MKKPIIAALLSIVLAIGCASGEQTGTGGIETTAPTPSSSSVAIDPIEHQRMVAYVNEKNDPRIVRNIIDNGDGEPVNCVDIHLQHGFDHPIAEIAKPSAEMIDALPKPGPDVQAYGTMGPRCAEGTIPQLRTKLEEIEMFPSLNAYLARQPKPALGGQFDANHKWATSNPQTGANLMGAYSYLNLFRPPSVSGSGFSNSQVWIQRGGADGTGEVLESLESGIGVFPSMYLLNHPTDLHVWIFYTTDNYSTVHWNTSGFVQTDFYLALGGYIPASACSVVGGTQVDVLTGWYHELSGWWYAWNGHAIGYYPQANFGYPDGLGNWATNVVFGGEVYDPSYYSHGPVTTTDMGSGFFAGTTYAGSYSFASYQRDMEVTRSNFGTPYSYYINPIPGFSSLPCAWNQLAGNSAPAPQNWYNYLFLGGNGYNASCTTYP